MDVVSLLHAVSDETSQRELQAAPGLRNADHFCKAYILPALVTGVLEMTYPSQPKSRLKRYRLTEAGCKWVQVHHPAERS